MAKIIELDEAVKLVRDGMTIMFGGFLGCGNPHTIVDALVESGVKDLTIIANDTAMPDYGIGKLIVSKQVKKVIASHVGTNPEVAAQMNSGELVVELVPQGSLIEKVRAGGAGLGGVLTPTGLGTIVAEGKQVVTVEGKDFLLETPLHADLAIVNAHTVDKAGNLWFKGTTRNFNQLMPTAADIVIVEADNLVEAGEIQPENVHTPGVFVDYIVEGTK